MKTETKKKEFERQIIETARKHSKLIPGGELVPSERPDWLIPSASVGIEVSELLPAKSVGNSFSGPQLSSFQESVVASAEKLYYSSAGGSPCDVLVFFKNEWVRKRDPKAMAQELAKFVIENYPSSTQKSITLQQLSSGVRGWVDGLSVVRISNEQRKWQAGGTNTIESVRPEEFAQRIAAKNVLLPEYRKRWAGWQTWLLLSTRIQVLHSVSIPREINQWEFDSGFDKVILSSWENGVIELRTTNTRM